MLTRSLEFCYKNSGRRQFAASGAKCGREADLFSICDHREAKIRKGFNKQNPSKQIKKKIIENN